MQIGVEQNSLSVSQGFSGCFEAATPLYPVGRELEEREETGQCEIETISVVPPTHTEGIPPAQLCQQQQQQEQQQQQQLQQQTQQTNREKFQAEISKWEEFYDQIHHHLSDQSSAPGERTVPKSVSNYKFSISQDGIIYYCKVMKDGSTMYLKVVRDYSDRVRICKEIHHDTGDVTLHHRRDKMLELLGQRYFWKGQRRDVCQCVRK